MWIYHANHDWIQVEIVVSLFGDDCSFFKTPYFKDIVVHFKMKLVNKSDFPKGSKHKGNKFVCERAIKQE